VLRCERLARQWHARGQGFKSPQLHQAQRIRRTPTQGRLSADCQQITLCDGRSTLSVDRFGYLEIDSARVLLPCGTMSQINPVAVEQEILSRLDPKGEMTDLMDTFSRLIDSRVGRGMLRLLKAAGLDFTQLQEPLTQSGALVTDMTQAVVLFTPLGWAPLSRAPVEIYREALAVYRRTGSIDEAEQRLLEGWNQDDWLRFAMLPLQAVGAGHDELYPISLERWRLVEKALGHHRNGAYEASVPIVLAQVDGICQDLVGSKEDMQFFRLVPKTQYFADASTIAGMPAGLEHLRPLFSEVMRKSGVTGKLSRHGILHGRELRYDTEMNSTKVLVLLAAVIEWAQAEAREKVAGLRRSLDVSGW
jgi:hypothetical protein